MGQNLWTQKLKWKKIEVKKLKMETSRMASTTKMLATKIVQFQGIGNVLPEINYEDKEHSPEAKLVILEKTNEHPKITIWVEPDDPKFIDFENGYTLLFNNTDGKTGIYVHTTKEYDINKRRNFFENSIEYYKSGIKKYEKELMTDKKNTLLYLTAIKILKYSINVTKCYINILNYLEKDEWTNIHKQQDLCVLFLQKIDDYLNDIMEVVKIPEVVYKDTVDDLMKYQTKMVKFIKYYECQREDDESDSDSDDDDIYYPTKN